MRIAVFSDLHFEVSKMAPPPSIQKADVVVLAGDIAIGCEALPWARSLGKPVVYVPGNHEYEYQDVYAFDKSWHAQSHKNVHCLQMNQVIIDGCRFIACTLWSDYEWSGYAWKVESMQKAQNIMPEFQKANWQNRMFEVSDALELHGEHKSWLNNMLNTPFDGPTVVVTHHAPHEHSITPQYKHQLLTGAFGSRLDSMLGRPMLWCHGHTHHRVDYWVGDTRIVSHPRGYYRYADKTPASWDRTLLFNPDVRQIPTSRRKHCVAGSY